MACPGPGMMKAEEYCLLRWESHRESGSGLVRLHIIGMLSTGLFAIPKNWLAWERQSLLSQK